MAYYEDDDLEQQDPNAPQQTGPQGSGVIQGGGVSGAPQAPTAPDRGSNFVGINQYINANKPQAEKLGDQASGVITNSANQARESVNNLNNEFNQKAGSAQTIDQGVLGKVNQAETLGDQEKEQIKSAYNAQYGGPNSLQDLSEQYNDAGKKLSTAKQNVEASNTEEGRQGLVTQINSKPRTAGINNFDNILLQTGGGREKLAQAASANQDVTQDVLAQNNLAAQQKAADIKSQTDATRQQTQGAVTSASQSLGKSLEQRLKEMRDGTTAKNNAIAQDLGDNAYGLDQETMDALGLSDGVRGYGIDPNSYLKQGDVNSMNIGNVAKQEEYARSQALADLAGGQGLLDQANISQAGTAGMYGSNFDKERLKGDIEKKDADFQKTYKTDKGVAEQFLNQERKNLGFTQVDPNLKGATLEEIESKWLPEYRKYSQSRPGDELSKRSLLALENTIANFKNAAGYNKQFALNKKG